MLRHAPILSALWLPLFACDGSIVQPAAPLDALSGSPTAVQCTGAVTPLEARQVRISLNEYQVSVDQLFAGRGGDDAPAPAAPVRFTPPFVRTKVIGRYSTIVADQQVTEYDFEAGWVAAQTIADAYLAAQPAADDAAMRAALRNVTAQLYSRDLADGELDLLWAEVTGGQAQGLTAAQALGAAVRIALASPDFWVRGEGVAGSALDPYASATLIARVLQQRPPDAPLWADAQAGVLDEAHVRSHVRRLLGQAQGQARLMTFLRELFEWDTTLRATKDSNLYPAHHPQLLLDDTEHVVARVVQEHAHAGLLRALLTTHLAFVRQDTAQSWAVDPAPPPDGVMMELPRRTGLLTHPSWLSGFAEPDHNHLVRRGRFVRERLLCGSLLSLPPTGVPFVQAVPGVSLRDRIVQQTASQTCQACHQLMNPLGFAFEAWDLVGRPATDVDGGTPDTSGQIDHTVRSDGPYRDAAELMGRLADSPEVHDCFLRQLFTFYVGRAPEPQDACELQRLGDVYRSSGEDVLAAVEELVVWQATAPRVAPATGGTP